MLQLPNAIKAAEQHSRDQQAGQNDMFGAAMGAAQSVVQIDLPTAPDWPLEQKLQGERDTLGHYLSGHPTDPWREELAQLSTCPLGEIGERYQPPRPRKNDNDDGNRFRRGPDTPWTVAGMVSAVRKRGDSDAFVRLEDGSGIIEVSFFGELYQQAAPLLVRDEILVVEGGLRIDEFSGGGFQLRARNVVTLGDACRRRARLLLKLNGIGPDFVQQLRQTLAGYRGGHASVVLGDYHNQDAQATLELGEDWRVDAIPDLLRAVRNLPGVEAARLRLVRNQE
jgi:DNA polymerase-3 subunit alpha